MFHRIYQIIFWILIVISLEFHSGHALNLVPSIQYAGFAGQMAVGGSYYGIVNHSLHGLIGYTTLEDGVEIFQLSFKWQYEPFLFKGEGLLHWKPIYLGCFGTYTGHKNFFSFTPEIFPTDYYRGNAFRPGVIVGTEGGWKDYSLYFEFVGLDTAIIDFYNNPKDLYFNDIFSAGIGARYLF